MTPTKPHNEYLASRVAAATPVELTRMLFEGAVQAVGEAITAHRGGDILARGNAVTKAVQILGELRFSLRRDVAPQYCDTLSGLYGYLQNRLIQAHAEKSESMLQEVLRLIQTLLDGWVGAMGHLGALETATSRDAEPAAGQPDNELSASNPYAAKAASEPQNRSWQL
ncbi:MAG: flagellar export chaperone FliS [Bryobacteraceae bacterium]